MMNHSVAQRLFSHNKYLFNRVKKIYLAYHSWFIFLQVICYQQIHSKCSADKTKIWVVEHSDRDLLTLITVLVLYGNKNIFVVNINSDIAPSELIFLYCHKLKTTTVFACVESAQKSLTLRFSGGMERSTRSCVRFAWYKKINLVIIYICNKTITKKLWTDVGSSRFR